MASEKVQSFIDALAPQAIALGQEYNLDPYLILSQGALESGWGGSTSGNNVFGVKSHGQPGGQTILTHEEVNGQMVPVYDNFRVYDSPAESMRDYAQFLKDNPRYSEVFGKSGSNAIDAVAAAGYATDSNYASKLKAIANMIDLAPYQGGGATMAYAPQRLPQIGPTGGPALNAINQATAQPAVMKPNNIWKNPLSYLGGLAGGIMQPARLEQAKQGAASSLLGTVAGRTAIMRALMPSNIGAAPSVMAAGSGRGTPATAVTSGGSNPVMLVRSERAPSESFDRTYHSGQNMDVYRANRESVGSPITSNSIASALSSGRTLYR